MKQIFPRKPSLDFPLTHTIRTQLKNNSRITNYSTIFLSQFLCGRLSVVKHYLYIDPSVFFLLIIFYHIIIMIKKLWKILSSPLFPQLNPPFSISSQQNFVVTFKLAGKCWAWNDISYFKWERNVTQRNGYERGCKKIMETGWLSRLLTTYKR